MNRSSEVDAPALVTIVVPMRDEAAHVEGCISRLASQTYGASNLEVLVADGRSVDGSAAIARRALDAVPFARTAILDNPPGARTSGLNSMLDAASGEFVVRIDCRAMVPPEYVERCVGVLAERPDVGVVGGAQVALPRSRSRRDVAIARALNNRLTMGGSRYRSGRASGWSDTVWLGTFRRVDLVDLGGWPAEIDVNEDYELNRRFRERGAGVWFEATVRSGYVPRAGLRPLLQQYFGYGRAKAAWWLRGQPLARRHWVLLVAPPLGGMCALLLARRSGLGRTVGLALGSALLVDAVGTPDPAPVEVRWLAGLLAPAIASAWWTGIVVEAMRTAARGR